MSKTRLNILDLPSEIIQHIAIRAHTSCLYNFKLTCKILNEILSTDYVKSKYYLRQPLKKALGHEPPSGVWNYLLKEKSIYKLFTDYHYTYGKHLTPHEFEFSNFFIDSGQAIIKIYKEMRNIVTALDKAEEITSEITNKWTKLKTFVVEQKNHMTEDAYVEFLRNLLDKLAIYFVTNKVEEDCGDMSAEWLWDISCLVNKEDECLMWLIDIFGFEATYDILLKKEINFYNLKPGFNDVAQHLMVYRWHELDNIPDKPLGKFIALLPLYYQVDFCVFIFFQVLYDPIADFEAACNYFSLKFGSRQWKNALKRNFLSLEFIFRSLYHQRRPEKFIQVMKKYINFDIFFESLLNIKDIYPIVKPCINDLVSSFLVYLEHFDDVKILELILDDYLTKFEESKYAFTLFAIHLEDKQKKISNKIKKRLGNVVMYDYAVKYLNSKVANIREDILTSFKNKLKSFKYSDYFYSRLTDLNRYRSHRTDVDFKNDVKVAKYYGHKHIYELITNESK